MKAKRILAVVLASLMLTGVFGGCGNKTSESSQTTNTTSESTVAQVSKEVKEPVVLKVFEEAKNASNETNKLFIADFEKATGIKVEFNVVPGEGVDKYKKIDIALMSGDETDLVVLDNPNFQAKYAGAELLAPLNDMAKTANYDLEKVYGKYLTKYKNDSIYYIPTDVSMNIIYYNKKIFDDAKVPYPQGAWTWDQYIDTAKKLTNTSKGIYGSLMQQWEYSTYLQAEQKKAAAYKEDGTSNFDDAAWKDALKWFADLSAVHKIQPSWLEMSTKKIGWDSFSSGKYGMQFIGSWYTSLMYDANYPRDWAYGIAPSPGDNVLSAGGAMGINANSKNKEAAFKYVTYCGENKYKSLGVIPARVDLTKDDYTAMFTKLTEKNKPNDATVDDFYKVLVDNGQGVVHEKVMGAGSAEINNIYVQEAEKYLVSGGKVTLEDTMKSIKEKADLAITRANETK